MFLTGKIFLVVVAVLSLLHDPAEGFYNNFRPVASRKQPIRSRTVAQPGRSVVEQRENNASFSIASPMDLRRSVSLGLFPRELTCDPGYFLCPDEECCADGTNCVADGCCPGTQEQCGTDKCYDPDTETCCSEFNTACTDPYVCVADGNCCPAGNSLCGTDDCYDPDTEVCCASTSTHCQEGYVCVEGGHCCPTGNSLCGTDGCYDPDTEVCCADTSSYCDKGDDCVTGGCCPTGQQPCGESKCYDPDTEICCTEGDEIWACDKGFACCNLSNGCYDTETEICCDGGACPDADTCCGEECCKDIATCGSDGFCTATITESVAVSSAEPSEEPSSDSAASTATTPTLKTPTPTSTNKCTAPTPPNSQTTTWTIPFAYNPSHSIVVKSGPAAGSTIPAPNGAILENMCSGISSFSKTPAQSITLTYGGKACKAQNYKAMCPKSGGRRYCAAGVASYVSKFYPTSVYTAGLPPGATAAITAAGDMLCDEFPFANSVEGGQPNQGSTMCVPTEDQNWQGRTIGPFISSGKIKLGDKYAVIIQGWNCATQMPDPSAGYKRSAVGGGIWQRDAFAEGGVNMTGPEMWHSFDLNTPGLNLMPMPLGDLSAGSYTANYTVFGSLQDIELLDLEGESYNFTNNADGSISFTLDDDAYGVSLSGTTTEDNVTVVYSASQLSESPTATPTQTSTAAPSATNGASYVSVAWSSVALVGLGTGLMAVAL